MTHQILAKKKLFVKHLLNEKRSATEIRRTLYTCREIIPYMKGDFYLFVVHLDRWIIIRKYCEETSVSRRKH